MPWCPPPGRPGREPPGARPGTFDQVEDKQTIENEKACWRLLLLTTHQAQTLKRGLFHMRMRMTPTA